MDLSVDLAVDRSEDGVSWESNTNSMLLLEWNHFLVEGTRVFLCIGQTDNMKICFWSLVKLLLCGDKIDIIIFIIFITIIIAGYSYYDAVGLRPLSICPRIGCHCLLAVDFVDLLLIGLSGYWLVPQSNHSHHMANGNLNWIKRDARGDSFRLLDVGMSVNEFYQRVFKLLNISQTLYKIGNLKYPESAKKKTSTTSDITYSKSFATEFKDSK